MKWKCNKCKNIQDGMRRTRQGFKRWFVVGAMILLNSKKIKGVDKDGS